MCRYIYIFLFFAFLLTAQIFSRQDSSFINIPYSSTQLTIDGNLDEWEDYVSFQFEDTSTILKTVPGILLWSVYPREIDFSKVKHPLSKNKIIINSYWNKSSLNFAMTVFDKHLFAEVESTADKPKIHLNDGIEIYIDSRNDSPEKMDVNDYQFLINIKNNSQVFKGDRRLIKSDTIAVPKEFGQNILFYSAVTSSGSINNAEDVDSFYIVEVSIPFASIGIEPETSYKLRLDFAVDDVDYPAADGFYVEDVSTNLFPFNWSGYNDFGYPAYWKTVVLSGEPSWFENLSEKYRTSWVYIFFVTLAVTLIIVIWLVLRINKLKFLPTESELNEKNVILVHSGETNHLSYNKKILSKASEFISANRTKNLKSEDVAKEIGLSLRNFQRLTKEELNITPTNFICIIKLKLAAEFLSNREGNVTDAAYEFGFTDPSYFSRLFKHHFGKSPSEYLRDSKVVSEESNLQP